MKKKTKIILGCGSILAVLGIIAAGKEINNQRKIRRSFEEIKEGFRENNAPNKQLKEEGRLDTFCNELNQNRKKLDGLIINSNSKKMRREMLGLHSTLTCRRRDIIIDLNGGVGH